jgi:hypothetical protein
VINPSLTISLLISKAEKRKYARKFSKLFYQYTDRVLGFQKLIRQANKDFYGNPSMFDYVPVQKKQLAQATLKYHSLHG